MDETYDGPFYQGFVFVLVSSAGKANHILTISLQIDGFGPKRRHHRFLAISGYPCEPKARRWMEPDIRSTG